MGLPLGIGDAESQDDVPCEGIAPPTTNAKRRRPRTGRNAPALRSTACVN